MAITEREGLETDDKRLIMKRVLVILALVVFVAAGYSQAPVKSLNNKLAATGAILNKTVPLSSDVVINPNPVTGESFSLQLQNLDKGKYSIYIFNKEGKKFLVKTLHFDGGSATEALNLPDDLGAGTYILQVLSKTSRYSKKMVVE